MADNTPTKGEFEPFRMAQQKQLANKTKEHDVGNRPSNDSQFFMLVPCFNRKIAGYLALQIQGYLSRAVELASFGAPSRNYSHKDAYQDQDTSEPRALLNSGPHAITERKSQGASDSTNTLPTKELQDMKHDWLKGIDDMDEVDQYRFACTMYSHLLSVSGQLPTVSFEQLLQSEDMSGIVGMLVGLQRVPSHHFFNGMDMLAAALALAFLDNGIVLPENPLVTQAVLHMYNLSQYSKKVVNPDYSPPQHFSQGRDGYKRNVPNTGEGLLSNQMMFNSHHVVDTMEGGKESSHSSWKKTAAHKVVDVINYYDLIDDVKEDGKDIYVKKMCALSSTHMKDTVQEHVTKVSKNLETHSTDREMCPMATLKSAGDESLSHWKLLSSQIPTAVKSPLSEDTLWSWREKISSMDLDGICCYIRKESVFTLSQQDTKYGETIIHGVIYCFSSKEVQSILQLVNDRGLGTRLCVAASKCGDLPLHAAVKERKIEAVEYVAGMCPQAIEMADPPNQTPLQLAFDLQHTECLGSLLHLVIRRDDQCSVCTRVLQPMLLLAMKNGYIQYLELVLTLKAKHDLKIDFNCTDDEQHTAWFHLLQHPQEVVQDAINLMVNLDLGIDSLAVDISGTSLKHQLPMPSLSCDTDSHVASSNTLEVGKRYDEKIMSLSKQCPLSGINGPPIQPLGSGSSSSDSEKEMKKIHLTDKQKAQRRRAKQRIMETRKPSSEEESSTADSDVDIDQHHPEQVAADNSGEEGDPEASENEAPVQESLKSVHQQLVPSHAGSRQSCAKVIGLPPSFKPHLPHGILQSIPQSGHEKVSQISSSPLGDAEPSKLLLLPNVLVEEQPKQTVHSWQGEHKSSTVYSTSPASVTASSEVSTGLLSDTQDLISQITMDSSEEVSTGEESEDESDETACVAGQQWQQELELWNPPDEDVLVSKESIKSEPADLWCEQQSNEYYQTMKNSPFSLTCTSVNLSTVREPQEKSNGAKVVPPSQRQLWEPYSSTSTHSKLPTICAEQQPLDIVAWQTSNSKLTNFEPSLQFGKTTQPSLLTWTLSLLWRTLHGLGPYGVSLDPSCSTSLVCDAISELHENTSFITAVAIKNILHHNNLNLILFSTEVLSELLGTSLTSFVRSCGYVVLQGALPPYLWYLFGFKRPWGISSSMCEALRVIVHVARSNKHALTNAVRENLNILVELMNEIFILKKPPVISATLRGKGKGKGQQEASGGGKQTGQLEGAREGRKGKGPGDEGQGRDTGRGGASKQSLKSKATQFPKTRGQQQETSVPKEVKHGRQYQHSVQSHTGPSDDFTFPVAEQCTDDLQNEEWFGQVSEESENEEAQEECTTSLQQNNSAQILTDKNLWGHMSFANSNHPLEIIRSHFTTYSKCCPRHDIQDIVVIATTCPASEALGPKRRYSSIKDLRKEDRHSQLNHTSSLSRAGRSGPAQFPPQQPQPVMADSPVSSVHPPTLRPRSAAFRSAHQHPLSVAEQREHKDRIRTAAELLHAQDYSRIFSLAYEGRPPPNLPPETHIAYVFITGLAYYKLSNHKESLNYFQQCLRLAEECGREGDVTLSCIYIGDIEFAQRNHLEAAKQYQRALHHYSRDTVAKDFQMILPTQSALCAKRGSALRNVSNVVEAIAAYEEAISRAESKEDKLSAHTSLGNLLQSVGENAQAVTEYEHSIQLATELQDFVSLGWAHGNMGNAYLGLYQRDKALHHLEKSLDLTHKYKPTPEAIGRAYNNLGAAYQSFNELEKAKEYYDLSLSQAILGEDIPGLIKVRRSIGNLLMIKKECDRAVPHYTEVLCLSQDKSTVSTARHNRGCAYYEWAESKKKNFLQRDTPSTAPTATKPLLHGPQFEDCEPEYRPPFIPKSIEKYYELGTEDLDFVIKHHEESFHSIKGSPKGLSLSASLFERNSNIFHRKQDCLVNMGKFEEALLTAEQSRARTLGELLLKRRGPQLEHQLTSPPSLEQLKSVVARQDCPVVYLSYTGARLLGWVFYPSPSQLSLNMFEVPLSDSEFDGKSFDYHLRYSLNEVLVEKNFEVYKPFKYDQDQNDPVLKLYDLVAQPMMTMFKKLKKDTESHGQPQKKAQKIIIIPDSYTNLLPMTCLLDRSERKFWGDDHYFQIMPSLLTMGILDQLPSVSVSVPVEHQQMLCVVGNPTIPMFTYNGEEWNLGKLPHATKEAEWVSHILNCTPILHEQATKSAVMMRLMNAKVIHLATHGSAAAGFLAFAGMSSSFNETVDAKQVPVYPCAGISSSFNETVDAKQVLIYPEEIERLSITPALVVLSSCDNGRGVVKADGIQGMAHAFILAGAQAVLTTLWRVPDESACIFMQFFYQYLMDGLKGTEALHKAILSVRCFSKYSQYIHWSGYQLTGREIQFSFNRSSSATELTARLGNHSIFPQLEIVKQLETAFLNNPRLPTDVQVLRGSPGVTPSEPLKDFIHLHHQHFRGGIYWISCRSPQLVEASVEYITKMMGLKDLSSLPDTDTQSTLVVFDFSDKVPLQESPLLSLLKKPNVHIVIISKHYPPPDSLQKEIDCKLLRGARVIDIQPLSTIHTTQMIVHSVLKHHHLASSNEQQATFEDLAEFTTGSPAIIDVVSSLLDSHLEQATDTSTEEALLEFARVVRLGELTKPQSVVRNRQHRSLQTPASLAVREISQSVCDSISTVQEPEDIWTTNSHYDSWQVITVLIEQCQLSPEERLLLFCLSNFNCSPIPSILVTEMATMIAKASHQSHLASSLHTKLEKMNLLKPYPKPVIYHPSPAQHSPLDTDFVYVPQFIAEAIWKDMMSDMDKVMALGTVYKAFQNILKRSPSPTEHSFLLGLCSLLVDSYELHYELVGKECFQKVYRLFLSLRARAPPLRFD